MVSQGSTNILLDYGAMTTKEPGFPMHVQPKLVDGLVLSHAHLDHSGSTPVFFLGGDKVKLHATPVTTELSNLLIEDFIKISGPYLPFEFIDLMAMNKATVNHPYKESFQIKDLTITFYDAGHIPGSCITVVEGGGKRLIYTGDINGAETELLNGSYKDLGEADMVITESTYATADHPARQAVEEAFVTHATEVVERGGVLLAPAFSVGRAQELAMTLVRHGFKHAIGMDGMALKVNEVLMRYQEYLRDPALFRRTLENTELINGWSAETEVHPEARCHHRPGGDARGRRFGLLQSAAVPEGEERHRAGQLPGPGDRRQDPAGQGSHPDKRQAHEDKGRSEEVRLFVAQRKGCPLGGPEGASPPTSNSTGARRRCTRFRVVTPTSFST